jgi:hypothetical protein
VETVEVLLVRETVGRPVSTTSFWINTIQTTSIFDSGDSRRDTAHKGDGGGDTGISNIVLDVYNSHRLPLL